MSIPYELIVTASHRPHLLEPTLASLLTHVDQAPSRILIHDDAVAKFTAALPGTDPTPAIQALAEKREATKAVIATVVPHSIPVVYTWADPPRKMGMALRWLLDNVTTPYVLYSQDDFVTVRQLPIQNALSVMENFALHQIRFNKRATMQFKETWQGRWEKKEATFGPDVCTVSDHWYFQTGIWRVDPIQAAIHWLTANQTRRTILSWVVAEEAVNQVMDGFFGPVAGFDFDPVDDPMDPWVRQLRQRTYIWGPIGEDRYVRHIGGADPSGDHERHGGVDDPAKAWREIRAYRNPDVG